MGTFLVVVRRAIGTVASLLQAFAIDHGNEGPSVSDEPLPLQMPPKWSPT